MLFGLTQLGQQAGAGLASTPWPQFALDSYSLAALLLVNVVALCWNRYSSRWQMGCVHPSMMSGACVSPNADSGETATRAVGESGKGGQVEAAQLNASAVDTPGQQDKAPPEPRTCPPAKVYPLEPPQRGSPPQVAEASLLLEPRDFHALSAAIPTRFRMQPWKLLYSSARDGVSLQTLMRKASGPGGTPSVLVVRDLSGHVFGCYASDAWRVAPRYYGNGECFVFQLQPSRALYRWWQDRMPFERNDFFQFAVPGCLAVGGGSGYAISLKEDLLSGSSAECSTFGSPRLAGEPEFQIGKVELWGLG